MPAYEVEYRFHITVEAEDAKSADERAMAVWARFKQGSRPTEMCRVIDTSVRRVGVA